MPIDIIIVNWNARSQLRRCLESIAVYDKGLVEKVVVVDNASTDRSIQEIADISLPFQIVRNNENLGFGKACNQGARGCKADYLLFLNPDTHLFADSLSRPIRFMEEKRNERIGICGIQLVDDGGQVSRTCARFPTSFMFFSKMLGLDRLFPERITGHTMREWDHLNNRIVDQVMGAFFLVRKSLFESLGGFDERFFVYFEEVDFSLRAQKLGYLSYYLADTQAYHRGGGTSRQVKAVRLFYSLRSRILFGYKHFGYFPAVALFAGTVLIEPFTRLVLALSRGSIIQAKEIFTAYKLMWNWLLSVSKFV